MGIQVSYDGELHKSQSSQGLVVGYLAVESLRESLCESNLA